MKQLALAQFNYPLLTSLALCLFLGLFLAALIWVYRRHSTEFYATVAQYPLQDDVPSTSSTVSTSSPRSTSSKSAPSKSASTPSKSASTPSKLSSPKEL